MRHNDDYDTPRHRSTRVCALLDELLAVPDTMHSLEETAILHHADLHHLSDDDLRLELLRSSLMALIENHKAGYSLWPGERLTAIRREQVQRRTRYQRVRRD